MSLVKTRMVDQIAVLEIDSPPVNALSAQLRSDMISALQALQQQVKLQAIVLHCAGSTFICGADIREFDGEPLAPHLPELIALLEGSSVPVVALLHGHVLGGGLEVAAACHYRVALKSTSVGLPEVGLGVVPGAGGCQRMMRLVGVEEAVKLATSGRAVKVTDSRYALLCEQLVDSGDDLLEQGMAWIQQQLADNSLSIKSTSELALDNAAEKIDWQLLKKQVQRSAKSNTAPIKLLHQLEKNWPLSVQQGEKQTRELFLQLRQSSEAKALRYAFFSEKKMQAGGSQQTFTISEVAVIGAGTMGSAIAICFADAGFKVILLEQSQQALERGLKRIEEQYQRSCKSGRISQAQMDQRLAAIQGSCEYVSISNVDLVIEAAFESLQVKQAIFKSLDSV
ncbi:MAG: hypothetical protein OFPI_24620 [Osedax symbiont Rs2]|nr:MAG: hypothetical protein OFPI_24620 [Osedax symbiont Rs2]